jgi:FkbH-like protein
MKSLWALLSNTTVAPLVPRLKKELLAMQVESEVFLSQYGEAVQQLLQPDSQLYAAKPDMLVLYLDLEQLRPDLNDALAFSTAGQRADIQAEIVSEVLALVRCARTRCEATILVNNFPVSPRTALGIGLEPVLKLAVRQMNLRLAEELADLPNCFLYDCDSLWAEVGWCDRDRRFEMLAQFPFGQKLQRLLVREWLRYFRALQGRARKCVVVDLDNTLWGGILGEDGPENIQMGDTPHGRPYRCLQQSLQTLGRRGILLAVCSKNNTADVLAVFRDHPDLLLRENDFASLQINWQDKATNLRAIASELNIGLQHLVFIDDNPAERQWVREALPEVLVPELPADAALFAEVLTDCELDTLALTAEDLKRTQMYAEDRKRREFSVAAPTYEEFLHELQLVVQVEALSPPMLDRAAQLCQRTNQFNLTTHRHTAIDLQCFATSPGAVVLLMSVRDRFGDYGYTGLTIAQRHDARLEIDSFMVSCRVLGKQVEYALFAALVDWARRTHCTEVAGEYIATAKNAICAEFYPKCGLLPAGDTPQTFVRPLVELGAAPIGHIKLSINL